MKAEISERAREAKAERKNKGGEKAETGKTKTKKHTQKKGNAEKRKGERTKENKSETPPHAQQECPSPA